MTRYWSRRALMCAVAAVVMMSQGSSVRAQSATLGSVWGVALDDLATPVAEVLVTLTEASTGLEWEVFTDRFGEFRFDQLHTGEYTLRVERVGRSPKAIEGIPIRPGRNLPVLAWLGSQGGSTLEVEPYAAAPGVAVGRPGSSHALPGELAARLPEPRRDVSELARLTSRSTDDLVVEGLPATLSAIAIDGTLFRPASHPHVRSAPYRTTAFSLAGIASAQLLTNELDVEWTGVAGATLSAHSRRGTQDPTGEARANWSGSVLPGPSFANGSSETYNDLQGAAALRGAFSDSARFSIGAELRRLQTPVASAWPQSPAAAELIALGQSAGLNLEPYRRIGVAPADAVTAFARLDWPVAATHRVGSWVQLATLPRVSGYDPRTATIPELNGRDILAGASLKSRLRDEVDNDLRVTYTASRRETDLLSGVAATTIVNEDLSFGGMTTGVAGEESRLTASNALLFRSGRHALKLGGGVTAAQHRYDHREGAAGEYFFGGVSRLSARSGVFVRTEGAVPAADWTTPTLALFAQDRWRAAEGVEMVVGVRAEREPLPTDRVRLDAEWQRLTNIANNETDAPKWRPAARVGVTWDMQGTSEWVLHAGGGMYYDRVDPLLLAQWQSDDGSGRVRREVGALSWPQPPAGGTLRPRLTVLGPDFDAPRTTRLSAGLVHALSPDAAVHVSGVIRRTDNLPRNTDLNLLPLPAWRDQFGRPVYGTLVQQGSVLAAVPGSNRRFDDYDEVTAITADGWSNHWGVTVGYSRALDSGVGVIAEYTYGSTTDNWYGARDGGWTTPLPSGLDAATEWSEGTSDFDIPHRAVLGVALAGPFGARVSALYRVQSGLPFTPGFRAGVDASGDGAFRNDPAFVDPLESGMVDLFNVWPCLRESSGRVAARNSCRASALHTLDLSAGIDVLRFGGGRASVTVDVFDLLESERAAPDAALYLVDPSRQLVYDEAAGTVFVPLVANMNFGEELSRPHAGRRVRLGFLVNW